MLRSYMASSPPKQFVQKRYLSFTPMDFLKSLIGVSSKFSESSIFTSLRRSFKRFRILRGISFSLCVFFLMEFDGRVFGISSIGSYTNPGLACELKAFTVLYFLICSNSSSINFHLPRYFD